MESIEHQQEVISQFTLQAKPFAENQAHSKEISFETIRDLATLTGNERILDCACGPGLVSCYLAEFAREVVGVDLTEAMVEQAQRSAVTQGRQNVSFQTSNVTTLPFTNDEFDGCVSRYAFHHLQAPLIALKEMVRVTRPGGRIVVADVAPIASKRNRYDAFERRRDPSHTTALTLEELYGLGQQLDLGETSIRSFGVPMAASSLIDSSFPNETDRSALKELLHADVGFDDLGFNALVEDGICTITFPVVALAWTKPKIEDAIAN